MRRAAGKLLRFLVALFPVPDLLLCAKHLFVAAKDWGIDGTLLDANGQPLDLSNATLMWMVIEPQGGAGARERRRHRRGRRGSHRRAEVHISVHHDQTALREAGRYLDALQVTIGDVVSPLWTGVILVAANPRRAMLPP